MTSLIASSTFLSFLLVKGPLEGSRVSELELQTDNLLNYILVLQRYIVSGKMRRISCLDVILTNNCAKLDDKRSAFHVFFLNINICLKKCYAKKMFSPYII